MTLVYLGIAVWVVVIINHYARRLAEWLDRPLNDTDRYCARADARLDELAARRATRPTGNCEVIRGPWVREDPTLPPTVGPFDRSGGAA